MERTLSRPGGFLGALVDELLERRRRPGVPRRQSHDLGDPAFGDAYDIESVARAGRPDAGAYESGSDSGGGSCGNGAIEGGEQCDGANLGGATCASLGYAGGTLTCSSSCTYDTSSCTAAPGTPQNFRRTDVK